MLYFLTIVGLLLCCVGVVEGAAYDIRTTTANWQTILSSLKAGDVATLHSGTYTKTSQFWQLTLNGTLNQPIVIKGAAGEARPIIQGTAGDAGAQNVVNIQGSNFKVKGLAFTKGSRGVRLGPGVTTNAIFDNILIFNTTGTAFSANDAGREYVNITLRNSEITNTNAASATTGECVYWGCSGDGCRVRDSILEHNYCHDTLGSVGGSRAGFQVKTGSHKVIIRNNVCSNVVGPCILVYDDYNRGRNLIDGNLAINAGSADVGIQCTSGCTITNNIVVKSNLAGIAIIQNELWPTANSMRNITISHNTVYLTQADACLRLNSVTNVNITVTNNALLCANQNSIRASSNLAGATIYNNGISGTVNAAGMASCATFPITEAAFAGAAANNFYPSTGSVLINSGVNFRYIQGYDFNGKSRSLATPTVGAYEYSTGTNPGCSLAKAFKCGSSTSAVPQYSLQS